MRLSIINDWCWGRNTLLIRCIHESEGLASRAIAWLSATGERLLARLGLTVGVGTDTTCEMRLRILLLLGQSAILSLDNSRRGELVLRLHEVLEASRRQTFQI